MSFAGLLGFVGLIVPHMVRRLVGGEGRSLLPGCALGGAALFTLCDIAARTLFAPTSCRWASSSPWWAAPSSLWLLFRKKGVIHP